MKTFRNCSLIILAVFLLQSCIDSNFGADLKSQSGTLYAGAPAIVDGPGVLFITADTTYGVPGTRSDYSKYFPEDSNEVKIRADVKLTGETTIRGWGSRFPEAIIFNIKVQ